MPERGKNILKYIPGEKSLKAPFIIYFDFECLLKKEQSCQNNPKKSYTERKAKHEPSGYSVHLMRRKTGTIYTEEKIGSKIFIKN